MSNKKDLQNTVTSLFDGMDAFFSSKTVVGEPIKVDANTTIIPLVDLTFGMGAGETANNNANKNKSAGGIGGKMTPSAAIVISNGKTKMITVKGGDMVSKIIDAVPEVIDKIKGNEGISDDEVKDIVNDAVEE